jgi:hypothetical protein
MFTPIRVTPEAEGYYRGFILQEFAREGSVTTFNTLSAKFALCSTGGETLDDSLSQYGLPTVFLPLQTTALTFGSAATAFGAAQSSGTYRGFLFLADEPVFIQAGFYWVQTIMEVMYSGEDRVSFKGSQRRLCNLKQGVESLVLRPPGLVYWSLQSSISAAVFMEDSTGRWDNPPSDDYIYSNWSYGPIGYSSVQAGQYNILFTNVGLYR